MVNVRDVILVFSLLLRDCVRLGIVSFLMWRIGLVMGVIVGLCMLIIFVLRLIVSFGKISRIPHVKSVTPQLQYLPSIFLLE